MPRKKQTKQEAAPVTRALRPKRAPDVKLDSQDTVVSVDPIQEDLYSRIAARAYLIAEQRGFEPGYELDDWLAAEAELNNQNDSRR
jgi:rRNA processing protein Krr1/Pno1